VQAASKHGLELINQLNEPSKWEKQSAHKKRESGKHKRKSIPRAPRTFTHNFLHALSQKALITLIMCVLLPPPWLFLFCLLASGSENKYGKITKISPRTVEDEQPANQQPAETKERNTLKCSK